jgi:phosphoribosylformylglycinamidine synthase
MDTGTGTGTGGRGSASLRLVRATTSPMIITRFFRTPGLSPVDRGKALGAARALGIDGDRFATEHCFYVASERPLNDRETDALRWLLAETFEPDGFGSSSFLDPWLGEILEVGPCLSFSTAWSTNAVAVCRACGLASVHRIERSRRFQLMPAAPLTDDQRREFLASVHDRMTECAYAEPLATFSVGIEPHRVTRVPVLAEGRAALERINAELGLAFDDWDLDYYTNLFRDRMRRDPTDVECFDIAQSNSEHSRHWFFKGRLELDEVEVPRHLIAMIQGPLEANPNNSVIAFNDNSSSIRGVEVPTLVPTEPGRPGPFSRTTIDRDVIFTAETHNFPSGVAPFPGAETGTGGRIRDVHATGRGSDYTAGTAAYCVGNLRIPDYELPWEDPAFAYPDNLASPLEIEIEASNGASDYGNKFGEPVIQGFTRSFGLRMPSGERREWIKPIMFSGGIGAMDHRHVAKGEPEVGMWVVKLGGPAYRIGMGGGAASSMVQGENVAELDFNAVQRGDAEMEQKVNRVIRACCELGDDNPIVSIHDQGAGGNCNVLKEIVDPAGARIEIGAIPVGDETLSVLEIWGAEYQENDALLLKPEHRELFESLCARENVPAAFVGRITGDGRIIVHDERDGSTPVDLALADVLGDMPRKRFSDRRAAPASAPLILPPGLTVRNALERVLRLLSVGSKRFLTTKVDRAVSGLIARQPCAGPLQLTVADVAVVAASHLTIRGAATAIGEQPVKGLLDPAAMARLAVGEALTNLVWAPVTGLADVRCSANWMWAAKLPGEAAALHDAAAAMCDLMIALGIAVDGGKDSISMAARAPDGETVKAPGSLVISAYCTCPDVTRIVTPDLERPDSGRLLLIDLSGGQHRLGGSALAQVWGQVGDDCPNVDDPNLLGRAFDAVQSLVSAGVVSAGHDRSDGGLVTTLLEMAFAGNCGLEVELPAEADGADALAVLFAEELGLVLEVDAADALGVAEALTAADVPFLEIGRTVSEPVIRIRFAEELVLDEDMRDLRDLWEATSFALDRRQADPGCVAEEASGLRHRRVPSYGLSFKPSPTPPAVMARPDRPAVAILREEGSNGDREMAAAFHAAGLEPWDVTMTDLLAGRVDLARFRGLAAVGGFSYADVLDSAKGWAGTIRFNDAVRRQFDDFAARPDTFSLGVCNGCQLLALLGWVPWRGLADPAQPRFVRNASGRFESRFVTVRIEPSPAILLDGMVGSTLGIWVQHGEGRALFPESAVLDHVLADGLAPVRFADDQGRVTEAYPFNPNGSPEGIAALCSPDGRHLAIMPHPERCFQTWQWGWMPPDWRRDLEASPWLRLFQNARRWCEGA